MMVACWVVPWGCQKVDSLAGLKADSRVDMTVGLRAELRAARTAAY